MLRLALATGLLSLLLSAEVPLGPGYMPVEISMTGGTVGPNNTVTYRVILAGTPDENQEVALGCTVTGVYSSLPSKVTVQAGNDRATFNATFASSLPSSWSITATAEGHTVSCGQMLPPHRRK